MRRCFYWLLALLMLSACAAPAGENAPVPPLQEIPAPPEPPPEEDSPAGKMRVKIAKKIDKFM